MDQTPDRSDPETDVDVVIVGGGPAGCSAGVFTARYGLETVIFDRGNAALRRSAYLANYLGFPAGIDIETFYGLMHDHASEVGCERIEEMVVSIEYASDGPPADRLEGEQHFLVETDDGRTVTTRWVIAAAWYDGEYLRPIVGDEAFEVHEHHGDEHEQFDPDFADGDGRTRIEGLYVAAPNGDRNAQAIISAGQGAHAARSLLEDYRRAQGYPEGVLAAHYDWLRPSSEFTGEWADRERWREWFDNEVPDEHDADEEELEDLREQYIDRAFQTKRSEAEIDALSTRGHQRLLEHIEDDVILEYAEEIQRTTSEAQDAARRRTE